MRFEEKLNELINQEEIPDELLPKNIARMLKAQSEQPKMITEHRKMKNAPNASAQRRTIIMRTAAAAAACAVFAAGMLAYNGNRDNKLDEQITYEAVSPNSYDELYNRYTGIPLNGDDGGGNTEYKDGDNVSTVEDFSAYDISDSSGEKITAPDIAKSDGNYMYCLKGNTLYIISLATMDVVSEIQSTLDSPLDIYVDGDRVIIISEETEEIQIVSSGDNENAENPAAASDVPANGADTQQSAYGNSDTDTEAAPGEEISPTVSNGNGESAIPASRTNTIVDIYSISDAAAPLHIESYKQNGSYTASRLVNGTLYTVTDYSDYRVKPLSSQADLDSFVPAYYIDGEKFFLKAADITVPASAANTDYTVISAVDITGGSVQVKAVLGSGGNVYCSEDTIYISGFRKKDNGYSAIMAFDISDGGISYRASGAVDGAVLGQQSMSDRDGKFMAASEITDENGVKSVSIYVMDKSLTVINSAGQLAAGENIASVRFEENYARLFKSGEKQASAVVDLASNPPTMNRLPVCGPTFLYSYSDNLLLGIGENEGAIRLSMYSRENGLMLNETAVAEGEVYSAALSDRRSLLVDEATGTVGVPLYSYNEFGTQNSYCVYSYDEAAGFVRKGVIEYIDIDDSMLFRRGEIIGDTLYVISEGRIISARLSDIKVIGSYEY